ncbi:MAG: sigma-70 family RNA polymerase sigma factor [Prevotella sp.]|nr:sigma-70 family RNA polymerase sigma factor [Prevotella sp.]MDY4038358.1 sigma-70 family RNA polymerase sigma factor [Prevotella sp.]
MSERYIIIADKTEWNEASFHHIYDRFFQALVMYAYNYIGDMSLAEDIVQDLFSTIWEKRLQFATLSTLRVYLYNAARNRVLDHERHQRVHNKYMLRQHADHQVSDVENSYIKEEVYNQLFAAIDQLPERQRLILLQSMEKRKVKEIAEALQISANSVKKQKQRALDTLRDMLTDTQMLLLLQMLS